MRKLALFLLLAFAAPVAAQDPAYLLWQYYESDGDPGEPNILYVLRHSPDHPRFVEPGNDYIGAEFTYLFNGVPNGEWYNDAGWCKFQFTTIPGVQGGGRVVGFGDDLAVLAPWAVGLPDRYAPPLVTTATSTKRKGR
jgi:hypothetical protein